MTFIKTGQMAATLKIKSDSDPDLFFSHIIGLSPNKHKIVLESTWTLQIYGHLWYRYNYKRKVISPVLI